MQRICGISACGRPLTRGEISAGLRLCTACARALADQLSRLPDLYAAAERVLEVSGHRPTEPVRRGRRSAGIRLNERTVSARSDTVRVLSSWCGLIVDECDATGPLSLEVPLLASFLRGHLRWLAAHAAAVDFASEVDDLVAELTEVLNPAQTRMIDLGPCANDGCGQTVRAIIGAGSHATATQVRCDDGHIWKPHQWLRLRHQLGEASTAAVRRSFT